MNDPAPAQHTIFDPLIGVERATARQIDGQLLREQFHRKRETLLARLAPPLLMALAHANHVAPGPLLFWLVMMLVLMSLRRWHADRALAVPGLPEPAEYRRQLRIEWLGGVALAMGWVSAMWLLGNGQADALFYFRLVFLAGVSTFMLGVLGLHPLMYASFMMVMAAGLLLYCRLVMPGFLGQHLELLSLTLLFCMLLLARSRDDHLHAREWVEARLNQGLLVHRLRETVTELQETGMRLEAKSRELERSNAKLNDLAIHDALTGAYNRGYVQEALHTSAARLQRYGSPLCVMMVDIDHFKRVNDHHGHAAGDEVLRRLAAEAQRSLRDGDVFGRWGGEEFIVLLPNIELDGATEVAERLRSSIAMLSFGPVAQPFGVTVSIGVSQMAPGESVESLVGRADAALYAAKEGGRNCVVQAGPPAGVARLAA